jgi:hypothetical protein
MPKKLSNIKLKERKTETYKLISMLYKFLKEYPKNTSLKKIYGQRILGYYDYGTDQIVIDYRKDIIATAFHELFHYLHPEWSESMVKYAESRMINFCTSLEIATFLKHLANKIYKAELRKDFFNISASSQREKKSD